MARRVPAHRDREIADDNIPGGSGSLRADLGEYIQGEPQMVALVGEGRNVRALDQRFHPENAQRLLVEEGFDQGATVCTQERHGRAGIGRQRARYRPRQDEIGVNRSLHDGCTEVRPPSRTL